MGMEKNLFVNFTVYNFTENLVKWFKKTYCENITNFSVIQ
jgi:hypothetical protein